MRPHHLRQYLLLAPALLLGAGVAAPASAQALAPGTQVRITADDVRTIGHVERSTPDSLALVLADGSRTALPWADIARVEHSAGRRGRPGRGALIGAGVMTALTVGEIAFGGPENEYDEGLHDAVLLLMLPLNAALGAGVGALVGLVWQTERWAALPLGPRAAGSQRGLGIAVTVPF